LSEFQLDCVHCGSRFGLVNSSISGKDVLRLTTSGVVEKAKSNLRFVCKKCRNSTVLEKRNGEWYVLQETPSNLYVPHYCMKHRISYYDPAAMCPFCTIEVRDGK
jgi:hypothetical protein